MHLTYNTLEEAECEVARELEIFHPSMEQALAEESVAMLGFQVDQRVRWALLDGFFGTVIEVVMHKFGGEDTYRVRWDSGEPTICTWRLLRPVLDP